jgi:integrase
MAQREGTWPGGYIRRDTRGRTIYIIRRSIGGVRYEVSTGATSLRAAMAQLERFETDPAAYTPGGQRDDAIRLDEKLIADYIAGCQKNSDSWLREKRTHLAWWSDRLHRVDLRRATLRDHILPPLKGAPSRNARIAVIKHLYSWLRGQDRIETSEDPCLGKLHADPVKPVQETKSKVIAAAHYEKARKHMVGHYRDALDLLAGTGWHVREAVRFAESGEIEPYTGPDPEGVAVLTVWHKSGRLHRTLVTKDVAAAATRLRARGELSESMLYKTLRGACDAAKVPRFTAGRFRHTVATLAWETGDAERVPAFLGHRSKQTTLKYYATRAVPPRVPTLR